MAVRAAHGQEARKPKTLIVMIGIWMHFSHAIGLCAFELKARPGHAFHGFLHVSTPWHAPAHACPDDPITYCLIWKDSTMRGGASTTQMTVSIGGAIGNEDQFRC